MLHYTGMPTAEAALARLTDEAAKVSAHYLIDEDGGVVALVDERHRAWHAGASFWRGRQGLNDTSIGIELVNPGHEWGYRPFPEAQLSACAALCRGILGRWPIPPERVLGHADIAPSRKEDPGELFDWRRLAAVGVGVWPQPGEPGELPPAELQRLLAAIGYEVPVSGVLDDGTRLALVAFQRHFRQERVDGQADAATVAMLRGLLADLARDGRASPYN